MKRDEVRMEAWIQDIQDFQRIAGIEIEPRKSMEECWMLMTTKKVRDFNISQARMYRIIQDIAINAGKN